MPKIRLLVLGAAVLAVTAVCFSKPPMRQHPSYHNFADQRTFLGVPNCLDVVSNLPFLFVGIWGLVVLHLDPSLEPRFSQILKSVRMQSYFLGVALTFFGSSYYHLHPANATLVWDRLPMTLGFMGSCPHLAERISVRAGNLLLLPLAIAGGLSVIYWYWTEAHGHGDLRPYFLVQFGALLTVLVILTLFGPRYTHTWCLVLALALYAVAKLLEKAFDPDIYSLGHVVSGHTLKHIAAAVATYFILFMLQRRTFISSHRLATVSAIHGRESVGSQNTSAEKSMRYQRRLKTSIGDLALGQSRGRRQL